MLIRSSIVFRAEKRPRAGAPRGGHHLVERPRSCAGRSCGKLLPTCMSPSRSLRQRVVLDVRRKCLVCDWVEQLVQGEDTDELGPLCARCHAPTERVALLARRTEPIARNPHAAALGRLGGLRGGKARPAALSPRRRREIARLAARARWRK